MIINNYIDALKVQAESMEDFEEREKLLDYIAWARENFDWLNPLVNKEDRILGKKRVNLEKKK